MDVKSFPQAERYLRTGQFDQTRLPELASQCDALVRQASVQSNRLALRLGRRFVERARREGGPLLVTALRARGWVALVAGRAEEAREHYLEARKRAGSDPLVRARIDRILIDVYMYLDAFVLAKRSARRALAVFQDLGQHADVARTQVNYANVLHRQDRHEEAGRLYREAAGYFAQHGPPEALALCEYNLANTRVQLFDFDEAEKLYVRSRTAFEAVHDTLHATGCLYGLAWLHMLQGDFHRALRELSECESLYRLGGQKRELLLCLLDRAETYLSLGLALDARRLARESARLAQGLKLTYELAKARLFEGRALLDLGRPAEARSRLRLAESSFAQLRNHGFHAAALMSLAEAPGVPSEREKLLKRAREGFRAAQLPLWEATCDLASLEWLPAGGSIQRRLARNHAVATVPHLFAGYHTRLGDRAVRSGRGAEARRHWEMAAERLDAVRSKLPPAQRAAFMRRSAEPHVRLVGAWLRHSPGKASAWAERHRHGGPWRAFAKPGEPAERRRVEESLELLAQQVAASSTLLPSGRRGASGQTPRASGLLVGKLRRSLSELDAAAGPPTPAATWQELYRAESHRRPIVQFQRLGSDLVAFVHHLGACRAHTYVGGQAALSLHLGRWRFLVETSASGRTSPVEHVRDESDVLNRLAAWLLPPLELPRSDSLLVLPDGDLYAVPWYALPLHGEALVNTTDVVLSPGLHYACAPRGPAETPPTMNLHVGSKQGLAHVDLEVKAIRERLGPERVQLFRPSRRADWPGREADLWHYAGHATLRADNPFYSALELEDGPLFAADLHLHPCRPRLVTLAACRTGPHSRLPGDEALGFVQSLLDMGAGSVVASLWAVADPTTADWMTAFYGQLDGGKPVSRAVRQAAIITREKHPRVYHWGAFAAYGSGQ